MKKIGLKYVLGLLALFFLGVGRAEVLATTTCEGYVDSLGSDYYFPKLSEEAYQSNDALFDGVKAVLSGARCPAGTSFGQIGETGSSLLEINLNYSCEPNETEICYAESEGLVKSGALDVGVNLRTTCCMPTPYEKLCVSSDSYGITRAVIDEGSCLDKDVVTFEGVSAPAGKVCCDLSSEASDDIDYHRKICDSLGGVLYDSNNEILDYSEGGINDDFPDIYTSGSEFYEVAFNKTATANVLCVVRKSTTEYKTSCEENCAQMGDAGLYKYSTSGCEEGWKAYDWQANNQGNNCAEGEFCCVIDYDDEDGVVSGLPEAEGLCKDFGGEPVGTKCNEGYRVISKDDVVEDKVVELEEMNIFLNEAGLNCCVLDDSNIEAQEIGIAAIELTAADLESLNPLQSSSVFVDPESRTPGRIISEAMTRVVFPVAGLGLFILIVWSGFQIVSGAVTGKQTSIDLGKKRLTAAIVGFLLLFGAYWLWQLVTLATGIAG